MTSLAVAGFLHAWPPPSIRGPFAEAAREASGRRQVGQDARTRVHSPPFPDRMTRRRALNHSSQSGAQNISQSPTPGARAVVGDQEIATQKSAMQSANE